MRLHTLVGDSCADCLKPVSRVAVSPPGEVSGVRAALVVKYLSFWHVWVVVQWRLFSSGYASFRLRPDQERTQGQAKPWEENKQNLLHNPSQSEHLANQNHLQSSRKSRQTLLF
ncbi:hypothetical protein Tco_0224596 [Tanacetum coccineum]